MKNIKQSILGYVYLSAMVIAIIPQAGCQFCRPTISLRKAPATEPLIKQPSALYQVAKFTSRQTNSNLYTVYAQKYLAESLGEAELSLKSHEIVQNAQIWQISGALALTHIFEAQADTTSSVKLEITFNLTPLPSDRIAKSIILTERPGVTPIEIRAGVRRLVDSFISRLDPDEVFIDCRLAEGHSRFDRQGRCLAEKGNYTEALLKFRQAIDSQPGDHASLYNAAVVCEALQEYQRARAYYKRALTITRNDDYLKGLERVTKHISESRQSDAGI